MATIVERFKRAPQPTGPFAGLPWWVRAIAVVGLPGMIAGYLLYFFVSVQGTQLSAMSQTLATHASMSQQIQVDLREDRSEHKEEIRVLGEILKQICVNGAVTAEERKGCFPRVP
jgi:hypothetical protein